MALSDAQPVPRVIRDGGPVATKFSPGKPIDELILAFESLGDNCEFGLVQRYGRVEPLGLLRFGGISFERLIAGLERRFDGLGTPGTIEVELAGGPGHREFMVRESVYGIRYHSGVVEGEITLGAMLERETRRLAFLRRKLLEDLRSGEKIFVWKSPETTNIAQVRPILDALRIQGPNVLLWVVEADQTHAEGTAERLDKYLLKGYIERFAPYEDAADIRPVSWFKVCQAAYLLCHPEQQQETSEPAVATTVSAQRPLTAFEILALHAVEDRPLSLPAGSSKRNWLQRVLAWLRFRGPN